MNCLLKHVIVGKIGAMRGSGKGHEQGLGDCKEKRRHELIEEARDHISENSLWKSPMDLWQDGLKP